MIKVCRSISETYKSKLWKNLQNIRFYGSSAYDHNNLTKIKLRKRLAWAILFGGTFVAALLSKKKRKSQAISEASLLMKNDHYHSKLLLYNYRGFVLPEFVMKNLDAVNKFNCREDDIFVMSFPKTGTTWLQEILLCIMQGVDANFITNKGIEDRFPYLEFIYPGLSTIEKTSGQRYIKTHLPFSLLPPDFLEKQPKIIYMLRNPKDVAVSYYHFVRMFTMTNYVGTFEDFFHDMLFDRVPYSPMWKHYLDAWSHKDDANVLILFYEELQIDVYSTIKKIAQFLGKSLSDDEVEKIADHCSFSNMASNPNVNYQYWDELGLRNKSEAKFMRKGKVGDWKNFFTETLNSEMDVWINNNIKNVDLQFIYNVKKDDDDA